MRKTTFFLIFHAALGCTNIVVADEPQGDHSECALVKAFLKKHVIGKTIKTPRTAFKRAGNIEDEFEDQEDFHNLVETRHGFRFDITIVAKQTIYDLDADHKRVLPGRDLSETTVYRCEFGERTSTHRLTGTARVASTTRKDARFTGVMMLITSVKIADGQLQWQQSVPGYMDFMVNGGKYKPGSFDDIYTLSIVNGKLQAEDNFTEFDVNPDTLKRTRSKNQPPRLTAYETERK